MMQIFQIKLEKVLSNIKEIKKNIEMRNLWQPL